MFISCTERKQCEKRVASTAKAESFLRLTLWNVTKHSGLVLKRNGFTLR